MVEVVSAPAINLGPEVDMGPDSTDGGIAPGQAGLLGIAGGPFNCPQCPKAFVSAKLMQQHQAMFHSDKSFVCEICGKAFRFRSNLAEHRSVHTALKPYVCKYCGKASRLKGNLTKHILKHHKKENTDLVCKDDIIVHKAPSTSDVLAVLQGNSLNDFILPKQEGNMLPRDEKGDLNFSIFGKEDEKPEPGFERAIFLSFGLEQGSMDLSGGAVSPDGSEIGTDAAGSAEGDSEEHSVSSPLLPVNTVGGATSLQALLAQVSASACSTPPPSAPPTHRETTPARPSRTATPQAPPTPYAAGSAPFSGGVAPLFNGAAAMAAAAAAANGALNGYPQSPSKTQCPECGKHFRKASALQLHMTVTHRALVPPASSISSCDEKASEYECEGLNVGVIQAELRALREAIGESGESQREQRLAQMVSGVESRVCKLEKNVETVLNSMYSLVQLQTGLNTSVTRFREDVNEQFRSMKALIASSQHPLENGSTQ